MKQVHVSHSRDSLSFNLSDMLAAIGRAPSFHPAFRAQSVAKTKRVRDAANKRAKRTGNANAATVAKRLRVA